MTDADPAPRRLFWWLEGRAGRREYWLLVAALFALSVGLSSIPGLSGVGGALTVALVGLQVRRLHDFARTGWWAAVATVLPIVVTLPLMASTAMVNAVAMGTLAELALIAVIGAVPGTKGDNRFGPPPPFTLRRTFLGR